MSDIWLPRRSYLFDEDATQAHDADGFFRTGDIGRLENGYYFIVGRASIDIFKSGGYKISAVDIEHECLELPYVNEAVVIGVDDAEWGQRVTVALSLQDNQTVYSHGDLNGGRELTLKQLRADLGVKLAGYKLPTLLRVTPGEIPKSETGKINKKSLGALFFPPNYPNIPDVQIWSSATRDTRKAARL